MKSSSHLLLALCTLATAATSIAAESQPRTILKTETFDCDPGWEGVNNRVKVEKPVHVVQDFGFSPTQHAGGTAPGEFGGRMQRSTTSAFYGLRLETPKTLEDKLHCTGFFTVTEVDASGTVYFGWFNTKTPGTRPYNWLGLCLNGAKQGTEILSGFRLADGTASGDRRLAGYGPGRYATPRTRDFNLLPVKTRYSFEIAYDPDGAAGAGEFSVTLGGDGPFIGGPFKYTMPTALRKSGATFNAFGMINALAAGGPMTAWFDLVIDRRAESFDRDPQWLAQNNRAQHDDYGLTGAHQFGFSDTNFAGGKRGELGGLLYSSPGKPGYYADNVGRLSFNGPLTASGRIVLKEFGNDSGAYLGWFDSKKRGQPPANVLGVLVDGASSSPHFQGCAASADPMLAHVARKTGTPIPPNGSTHIWKIAYDPLTDGGAGRLTVWLDDREDSFPLTPEMRKVGAAFDRFGLFVHEGGGGPTRIWLDDLTYTASKP